MKKPALVIAAMLAVSFMLPAQASNPMGFPEILDLTDQGQQSQYAGFSQHDQRPGEDRARQHHQRNHHRRREPRRHVDG